MKKILKEIAMLLGIVILFVVIFFATIIFGDDELADRNPYKGTEYEEDWDWGRMPEQRRGH